MAESLDTEDSDWPVDDQSISEEIERNDCSPSDTDWLLMDYIGSSDEMHIGRLYRSVGMAYRILRKHADIHKWAVQRLKRYRSVSTYEVVEQMGKRN